jgi:hypothetical protein
MLSPMPILCPTPRERLLDAQGRPYFLWDADLTLDAFLTLLRSGPREERGYWLGRLLRQAKPDDALQWVKPAQIAELWPYVERHLGRSREFWTWLLGLWGYPVRASRPEAADHAG